MNKYDLKDNTSSLEVKAHATINDSGVSATCESSYENTIRQFMNASHQPAVLAVAFGSVSKTTTDANWKETYEKQAAINAYYGIPYINVQKYAEEQVAAATPAPAPQPAPAPEPAPQPAPAPAPAPI